MVHNDASVVIRSAAGIWDASERKLTVAMFPFELSPEDVATLQVRMPVFLAASKPSPDPKIWTSPPFAVLEIELNGVSTTLKADNIRHYVLHAAWIRKKNATVSANRNSVADVNREFPRLAGKLTDGGSLRFTFRGAQKFPLGDDFLEWAVEVDTVVRPKR